MCQEETTLLFPVCSPAHDSTSEKKKSTLKGKNLLQILLDWTPFSEDRKTILTNLAPLVMCQFPLWYKLSKSRKK